LPPAFFKIYFTGTQDFVRRFLIAGVQSAAALQLNKIGFIPLEQGNKEKMKKSIAKNQPGCGIPATGRADNISDYAQFFGVVLYTKNTYKKHKIIIAHPALCSNFAFNPGCLPHETAHNILRHQSVISVRRKPIDFSSICYKILLYRFYQQG
jgi:hypothetical protein